MDAPEQQKRFLAIKALEADELVLEAHPLPQKILSDIEAYEDRVDDDFETIVTNARYEMIQSLRLKKGADLSQEKKLSFSDKVDLVLTNRFLALPIFALIMWGIYYIAITTVGDLATGWANDGVFGEGWSLFGLDIPGIPVAVTSLLESIGTAPWLVGLIVDGIVGGVGAILGFVPQMLILFLLLSLLEGSGYMARVAFIMDRIFRRFGLSGKSFIPMLVGTGCSIPGIMATRTIENQEDRRMTIITTPFMPCGAKLPVIALFAGALFGGSSIVATGAYFMGIFLALLSGIILKKTKMFASKPAPFIMELPEYHFPGIQNVLKSTWERGWSFIKKAGTVILLSSMVIWFLSSFGLGTNGLGMVDDIEQSLLAGMGRMIAPVFEPLGFGNWKASVATINGLVAKENVVSTYGVLYGMEEVAEDGAEIWAKIAADFSVLSGLAFLLFNLYCSPCFAAIGATKREMNSAAWTTFAIVYQTVLSYAIALMVYQFGQVFSGGSFGLGTIFAIIALVILVYLLVRPSSQKKEYADELVTE